MRVRGPWGPFELSGVAVTISRPETQTKKLKLTLANSPLFILKNAMFACLLSLNWEKWQNSDKNCKLVTLTSFARYAISALGTGKDRRHFLRNLGMIVQNGGHFGECRYAWSICISLKKCPLENIWTYRRLNRYVADAYMKKSVSSKWQLSIFRRFNPLEIKTLRFISSSYAICVYTANPLLKVQIFKCSGTLIEYRDTPVYR